MTRRVAVIGAGLAGLACATALRRAGHAVTVLDKGRGPGGRMSARRVETPLGQVTFDHGAQYFTARDPGFQAQVRAWAWPGSARPGPRPARTRGWGPRP
ncbi:FAD-dependent oxidoreductase [Phenylobacterium sp.]|uniref:FAD-dependent oxidoreductase n=1 Tax=Phenylobacterium sp. TaxID=1871053 RepID=UPI002736A411|nr:FAD-dependent oxidoreductase [Phenylobacterium sp.]MDP3634933.1 FAD-dependent oxidoreductase [Phenylobacterium sp.]